MRGAVKQRQLSQPDPLLLVAFGGLIFLGMIMVFSASAIWAATRLGDPLYFLKRHLVYLAGGILVAYVASRIRVDFWRVSWAFFYVGALFFLILTLFFGKDVGGARRWLYVGPFGFQFAELAKFALVVALARYADRYQSRLNRILWALVFPTLLFLTLAIPIVIQPDLGSIFVLALVFFSLALAAGIAGRYLAVFPLVAVPVFALLVLMTPYRMKRVFTFVKMWKSGPLEGVGHDAASYQLSQALLALGSGGILGKGLGNSDLKLNYLPQPHTDFIFPIIGEELGFLGSLVVIMFFVLIALRGVRVALKAKTQFASLLALGITFLFVFQAAIHMAVTTALVPTKGITLPFISYGGSSLMVSMLMAGILLRLSRRG